MNAKECDETKGMIVVNIGLSMFYEALRAQDVDAISLEWRPPFRQSEEIQSLLDDLL